MKEPTQEQIKEFWEWCGFEWVDGSSKFEWVDGSSKWGRFTPSHWNNPEHIRLNNLPTIDLNNLFKWAVLPKLQPTHVHFMKTTQYPNHQISEINCWLYFGKNQKMYEGWSYDPALALFWAIYQVIKE